MRNKLLLAAAVLVVACTDGRERGEGVPPSTPSDSSILADTVTRDITVPNDPGVRG